MPSQPLKSPGSKALTAGRAAPAPKEDELVQRLEQTEAQLGLQQDKLARLTTAQAALGSERTSLNTQLTAERTQLGDISSFLRHALAEQTARAEGLERELAEARSALAVAIQAQAQAAAAAEVRHQADLGERQAVLDAQVEQVREAEAVLLERDSLRAQAAAAREALEEERQAHQRQNLDLERKHASDRELWRKDTAEAVREAREEMAALTDQRLDATTKQAICTNEAMAGELQYQGRHVQGLLARNSALQKEVADLRLALGIGRKNEEELARKSLAREKTLETLLARLEEVGEQVASGKQAKAELTAQLDIAQGEVLLLRQHLEDQGQHMAGLEGQLEEKKQELRQLQASHGYAASFLLQCLAEARQEALADHGRAVLAAASSAASLRAEPAGAFSPEESLEPAAGRSSPAGLRPVEANRPRPPLQVAAMRPGERQALLQRLLDRLGADWQGCEGLALPASSSQSASLVLSVDSSPSRCPGLLPASCNLQSLSPSASGCAAGGGSDTSTALMRQLRSEVRPWGASSGASSGAAAAGALRRQASPASSAS